MGAVIDVVAGARPNFMKVAPILRVLASRGRPLSARLVHTGQHYAEGMSDVFFRQLGIPTPDVHLDVGSGRHGEQTARVLERFEKHLLEATPRSRGVVVVGDVNSTAACALAAIKLGIPVAHVEAGLRSFDRSMPEEINRLVTDAIADLLLVSEPEGEANLRREGIAPEKIRYVGNVMIDTLVHELPTARGLDLRAHFGLSGEPFAYVTLHRPANVDTAESLAAHVAFLERVSRTLALVFPVHPRTLERLRQFELLERLSREPRIQVLAPLGYHESLALLSTARLVLTDSGGIQEEASYLGVPCLTLRPNTERPATVTFGTNTVVGDDLARAEALVAEVVGGRYKSGQAIPGWDGRASERVVDVLAQAWT
jgi:UDP-N-acetylglucosamine 2-epimerase (non-hydrolysing)